MKATILAIGVALLTTTLPLNAAPRGTNPSIPEVGGSAGDSMELFATAPTNPAQTQRDQNEELWLAALGGNTGRIRALVEQGADPSFGTRFGETALHAAASRGHLEPLIYLANHGGNINARTSKGWTPLHHAARFGHTEAVRYLLRMGAIPHSRTNDRGNKTPMQMAVDGNHIDIALLLGYRPRPNQR